MCGHIGIISRDKLSAKEKALFATLLTLSVPRGKDSTGVLGVEFKSTGDLFAIEKEAVRAENFLQMKGPVSLITDTNNILMGHVRAATIGEVKKETAHPYHYGDIIGFHNGTIRGYKEIDDLTDSSKFYRRVSEKGFKEALEELPQDSAYAFCFYDKSNGRVHLFRNKRRDLYLCVSLDNKTLIYASEERFIKTVLEYVQLTDKFGKPYELHTNTLLHIFYDQKDAKSLKFHVVKDYLNKEILEKHEKNTPSHTYSNWHGYMGGTANASNRVTASRGNVVRIPDVPSGLPRKNTGGKVQYPFTTYEFNAAQNKIRRIVHKSVSNSTITYFFSGHHGYCDQYETAKKFMILAAGGCYIEIDEQTYDFVVSIPGKRKVNTRRVLAGDARWDGWWNAMLMISEVWEKEADEQALTSSNDFVVPSSLIFGFNDLHSFASKNAGDEEKRKGDDNLPFDRAPQGVAFEDETNEAEEFTYVGYQGEELSVAEAIHRLGNSCCNCFEHSTINETVYWLNRKDYVCEPCTGLAVVQQHLNLYNSTRGHLKEPQVFKRTMH